VPTDIRQTKTPAQLARALHDSVSRKGPGRRFGLSLPSPPAEKATAREQQAGQASAGDGHWNGRRCPKGIVELKTTGHLACRQIENQFDICEAATLKPDVD
jgi:hypothetical protein